MNKLRQVLSDPPDRPRYVETIPKKGYSFVAKFEELERVTVARGAQSASIDLPPSHQNDEHEGDESKSSSGVFHSGWMVVGGIALLIAGMLIAAALAAYAHLGM